MSTLPLTRIRQLILLQQKATRTEVDVDVASWLHSALPMSCRIQIRVEEFASLAQRVTPPEVRGVHQHQSRGSFLHNIMLETSRKYDSSRPFRELKTRTKKEIWCLVIGKGQPLPIWVAHSTRFQAEAMHRSQCLEHTWRHHCAGDVPLGALEFVIFARRDLGCAVPLPLDEQRLALQLRDRRRLFCCNM